MSGAADRGAPQRRLPLHGSGSARWTLTGPRLRIAPPLLVDASSFWSRFMVRSGRKTTMKVATAKSWQDRGAGGALGRASNPFLRLSVRSARELLL